MKKVHMNHSQWTSALVLLWVLIFSWSWRDHPSPVSRWMVMPEFSVTRVTGNTCHDIHLSVSRTVRQSFTAVWTVTILRQNDDGDFFVLYGFSGRGDYRPDNGQSAEGDLCWWIGTENINLYPGTYMINTVWNITTDRGARKTVRIESDPFVVP